MEKKNPLIAGLLNTLIPGSANYYVGRKLKEFLTTLAVSLILIFLAVTLANAIENIRNYSIAAGICPTGLLLVILVPLFLRGMKLARTHNAGIDSTAIFNRSRKPMNGTDQSRLDQIQMMRATGLISEQEYGQKKDKVDGEKKAE
jgi:predicted PurR-regulated permease PerM